MVYELILVNENLCAWTLDRTVPLDPLLKEDFHGLIRTDWDAQFAGDALVPFKGDFHIRPLDIQCLCGTDADAGRAVGTTILMPFDVLSQRLDLHTYLAEIFKPRLHPGPLPGKL